MGNDAMFEAMDNDEIDDADPKITIGGQSGVALNASQAQAVMNTMSSAGWRHLELMFNTDKTMIAFDLVSDTSQSTGEQVGAAKGGFAYADMMSNLKLDVQQRFDDTFRKKEETNS